MLIAVGFAYVLRGRGGDVISRAGGSGVLDEGALAAKAELQGRPARHRRHRHAAQRAMTGVAPRERDDICPARARCAC
jgi:hypothetical protein